jgi:hypothetical protein
MENKKTSPVVPVFFFSDQRSAMVSAAFLQKKRWFRSRAAAQVERKEEKVGWSLWKGTLVNLW